MTEAKRFDELLWTIAQRHRPLGIAGDLSERIQEEAAALDSLRESDISVLFDLIGYDPPRELWLEPDQLEASISLFLSHLAEEYPYPFLSTLEDRICSIPTTMPIIDGVDGSNQVVGRAICDLVSSRRCLSPAERVLLKERCATIGCRYLFDGVTLNSAWRTSDVTLLAEGIYDAKAFDRMPILADALQDAGCDNDDILSHCRDTLLTHVRGCWVVDLVLGRE